MTAVSTPGQTPAQRARMRPVDPALDEGFNRVWDSARGWFALFREVNNIPIAHKYMATGFLFFLTGGALALFMRIQLGSPENTFLDPETYNQLFTMHGTTMMFLFVIPFIEAVANYLLPLLLGTRDLPFPRLTALSYWTYVFGGVLLYASFLFGVAPDGGWFAYVPLTNREYSPGINMDFWDIGLSVAEVAAMGAAAELIVSVLRMRAPGMSLSRMPLFCWAILVTAFMIIFAFTPLIVGTAMLEMDRKGFTSFFVPEAGGDPLLWQHLFWVFGHPEVYIMFVPAVGIVSQIVQTFSRRPVVGYSLMVLAIIATGFISFGLWVHHMFTTGLPTVALGFFTAASLMIAIPAGVQIFGWIATIWTGRPVWRTPLLFVAGFIVIFVLGGVTGVMVGSVPFDTQVHDSYFVVAHFHYVLIGGVVFPLFGGLYYWLPKVIGRVLDERLGRWNFWTMFIFFNIAFFPMHIAGLLGMPRRIYTYPAGLGWDVYNLVSTIGAFGFAVGVLLFVVNFFWSLRHGEEAGGDPFGGDTLEWAESSPPPNAQFQFIPEVRSRHPLWEQDTLEPQTPRMRMLLDQLSSKPTKWRGALVVSVIDAEPQAIVHMPSSTIAPFVMAVGFLALFFGAIVDNLPILGIGTATAAVALVGWFWPRESERIALREMKETTDEDRLPLAVAGPEANGYWGTVILVLILATALFSLFVSYFYLGGRPASWPPPGMAPDDLALPGAATAAIALMGVTALWMGSGARRASRVVRGSPGRRRVGSIGALMLGALFVWLTIRAFRDTGLVPRESAYGSAFLGLIGFQWTVMVILLVMLGIAAAWAWLSPDDRRGDAVALNASLVSNFALASWIVVFVTLYVTPKLW